VLFALLSLCALAAWTIASVDEAAIARQTRFLSRGVAAAVTQLPKEQQSSAIWDDAVLKLRSNDQVWMEENLGLWMGTYFGHDRVYMLDPHNIPVHAMVDEVTVEPSAFQDEAMGIMPLVEKLRSLMADASSANEDSTVAISDLGVEDFVLLGQSVALVSVLPVLPSTKAVIQLAGTEYLHISVQLIDAAFLSKLAEPFELDMPRLTMATGPAIDSPAVPITDHQGRILAFVQWKPDLPGSESILSIAPATLAVLAAGLLLLGWLVHRLRRSSTKLEASEAQAQFLAFHDVLTGLPNRALFEDRLARALLGSSRPGTQSALLMADIDRFKNVNDTLGHPAGDELIRQVGVRLTAVVRNVDTVARLGGDEFAIVLQDIKNDREAELTAGRVIDAFEQPFELGGEWASVSISIGIAITGSSPTAGAEMQRKADIALYEAKAKGRGRYQVFDGDLDEVVRRRRTIERDLKEALQTGKKQLRLVYQPLFDPTGRKVVGAEALARWDHPEYGTLSPELFISIAEERGLIDQLGEWVLREACRVAVELDLPWIAVNVSPIQFRNARLVHKVMAALEDTGLSPRRLQLEITEGVLLERTDQTQVLLNELRSRGIRIALDDFGTGYSSMNYLGSYTVDKLKIDRSFISQLGTSSDADALVRAMITLGRSMHLQITAEGVETEDQRDHLAALGCHELQGYLMSRPIDAERLKILLSLDGQSPEALSA